MTRVVRDRSRGIRPGRPDGRQPDDDPVEQLHAWRDWQNDGRDWREDTVEMPVVRVRERAGTAAQPGTPRRRRPRGLLAGAAVLVAALALGGLAAAGVGPVRDLVGSGSATASAGSSSTAPSSSGGSEGTASPSASPSTDDGSGSVPQSDQQGDQQSDRPGKQPAPPAPGGPVAGRPAPPAPPGGR